MDLGDLKIRVNLCRDLDDLVLVAKRVDKCSEILVHWKELAHEIHESHEKHQELIYQFFVNLVCFVGQILFTQVVLAQIEVIGLDDIDLHTRKAFGKIILEDRIVADDDDVPP